MRNRSGLLALLFFGLAGAVRAAGPATTQALPPASRPAVSVKLDKSLPTSPGFHLLRCTVTAGNKTFPMSYGLFLPAAYFSAKDPFPLVITLHNNYAKGVGGLNLDGEGFCHLLTSDVPESRSGPDLPKNAVNIRKAVRFVGLAPQCPQAYGWDEWPMPQVIAALIDRIEMTARIDDDRIYLTGFSYGGTNTWAIGQMMPERFAAIVPISGRATADPKRTVEVLKDMPIYVATGTGDWAYPHCQQMADALKAGGHKNYIYTVIPNGSHFCYPAIYADPKFWEWLFAQRRSSKPGGLPHSVP